MKDRIANALLALAACSVLTFVACLPATHARQQANASPSCLWEWTAFGWVIRSDRCFGFCNYPDNPGTFIGDLTTTPCLG